MRHDMSSVTCKNPGKRVSQSERDELLQNKNTSVQSCLDDIGSFSFMQLGPGAYVR